MISRTPQNGVEPSRRKDKEILRYRRACHIPHPKGKTFRFKTGLEAKPAKAKLFYASIALATLVAAGLSLAPIDPVRMLFWSAVINGVISVPLMVVIMMLATRRSVLGKFRIPLGLKCLGWAGTGVMTIAAIVMFATWGT